MAAKSNSAKGPRLIDLKVGTESAAVYANAKVLAALKELMEDTTLYSGVRFTQVAEAIYKQGLKDGRRQVFEELDRLRALPELKHTNPGRPGTKQMTPAKQATTSQKEPSKKAPRRRHPPRTAELYLMKERPHLHAGASASAEVSHMHTTTVEGAPAVSGCGRAATPVSNSQDLWIGVLGDLLIAF